MIALFGKMSKVLSRRRLQTPSRPVLKKFESNKPLTCVVSVTLYY